MAVACLHTVSKLDLVQETLPGRNCEPYPWYALRVRTKVEKTAAMLLESKGYSPFLPISRVRRRWSDRMKMVEQPLFPGYLFCRFNIENRLPLLTTPGVIGIVGFGRTQPSVPEAEINSVRCLVNSGILAKSWPFLAVGQKVAIEHGPLAGVQGVVTNANNGYRIVV